jgi:hypothetical protein
MQHAATGEPQSLKRRRRLFAESHNCLFSSFCSVQRRFRDLPANQLCTCQHYQEFPFALFRPVILPQNQPRSVPSSLPVLS